LPIPDKNYSKSIKVLSKVSYNFLSIAGLKFGTTTLLKVLAMNLPTGFIKSSTPFFFSTQSFGLNFY
jgi:hypothetical protein